jgi:enterochelin esterase-like enzyme
MSHPTTFTWTDSDPARPAKDVLVRLVAYAEDAYEAGDLTPYLLDRQADGLWSRTISLPGDLRTSYQLCPARDFSLREGQLTEERWHDLLAAGEPDPAAADGLPPGTTWGNPGPASVLSLPDALPQPWTAQRSAVDEGGWERSHLGSSVVASWLPRGHRGDDLPVVISFDGASLARLGIETTFANLVADKAVPPFRAILVESIHGSAERGPTRIRSLTHPGEFATFVLDELLPFLGDPATVVLAGQSLGGLAATDLARVAADRVSAVVAQSAALWWPGGEDGGLSGAEVVAAYESPPATGVRFFVEAGSEEGELLAANERFRSILDRQGYDVRYRVYRGGHDYACWRGGLADGIVVSLG